MNETRRDHAYLDLWVESYQGSVFLGFGPTLSEDDAPVDGEVIRFAGRLYMVGETEWPASPILHETGEAPGYGLWWDADDASMVESAS